MRWKKRSLADCRLYLILDTEVANYDQLFEILKVVIRHGVDIVQLRDKNGNAKSVLNFVSRARRILKDRVPLIINDRVDLALASEADGVHLGQDDLSVSFARRILGPKALIGASCQNLFHAGKAARDGADYIGFGSVFKTKTKPGRRPMDLKLLKQVNASAKIPVFAIGGITAERIAVIKEADIRGIAVCRAILEAADPAGESEKLRTLLDY